MEIKYVKEVCGETFSAVLDETLDLEIVKKTMSDEDYELTMDKGFGVIKYRAKNSSKEVSFFEHGEILLFGFKKEEAVNFVLNFKEEYNKRLK